MLLEFLTAWTAAECFAAAAVAGLAVVAWACADTARVPDEIDLGGN